MAPGGIYRKYEESEHTEINDSMIQRKAGGFLLQYCPCGSERTSLPVIYVVNAVSFLLWIILFAVMISKYSEMAKKFDHLHDNQIVLISNGSRMEKQLEGLSSNQSTYGSKVTEKLNKLESQQNTMMKDVNKRLADLETAEVKIQADTFKLQEALYKINDSACQVCPEGWLLNRGHCYHFQDVQKHWSFAQNSCKDQKSSLVVINDNEEQMFLTSHSNRKKYWIGLSDIHSENTFVWEDGSSVSFTYWNPREPNNAGRGQDCVVMTDTGRWDDTECGGNADGWICEKAWKC